MVVVAASIALVACQPGKQVPFDPSVGFYQRIDGPSSFRSYAPRVGIPLAVGGTVSQFRHADGSVGLWIDAGGFAANGFVLVLAGTLSDVNGVTVSVPSGAGAVHLGLLFDVGGDGDFFVWDGGGRVIGAAGDKFANTDAPALTIDDNTVLRINAGGEFRTVGELKAGHEPGITGSTRVALSVGICCGPGSVAATITGVAVNGVEVLRT